MNNATLVYVINNGKTDKDLKLYSETLFNLDKYTCKYKNEDDFINKVISSVPELPDSRKNRYLNEYGLNDSQIIAYRF